MSAPAHYCPALIKRHASHCLLVALLTGMFAVTSPVLASGARASEHLKVSQTLPEDANDPLRLWFAEQDRLLDDILVRLSRIENLVREIHQLLMQLPSGAAASGAAAVAPQVPAAEPAATPAAEPVAPPPAVLPPPSIQLPPPKPAPTGILGFFDEWGSILAGIGLLLLVLMIVQRHSKNQRKPAQPVVAGTTTPKTSLEEPKFWWRRNQQASNAAGENIGHDEPAFLLEPEVADTPAVPSQIAAKSVAPLAPKVSVQPVAAAAPMAPAPTARATADAAAVRPTPNPNPSSPSHIQRGGATEPSKGHADQALELADIMLSMGLGHGAAQTLTEQIRNEPKQALLHWLKLLEIYRKNGQQAEFEASAEELRQHFNVQPEDWQVRPESLRSIEDYPHIAARMCELWARPACLVYLQNLLADNRGGARSGFPQAVAEEFLLLTSMLKARGIAPEADAAIGG